MATECVRSPLVPGRNPDDATSQAGQALKDGFETLTQQDGFQRLYWGREVENPDVLRIFIDWDSVDAHKKFMGSEQYGPFTERLSSVLDLSNGTIFHVPFEPHPPTAALSDTSSPVTEIVTVHLPTSYSSSDQETFVSGVKKLVKAVEDNSGTYHGSAGGWAEEEVDLPDSKGEKTKAYVILIGWDSVEAHMAFRETQSFKDNVHYLREAKDLKAMTVQHASCSLVNKEGGVGDNAGESVQEEILNPQQGGKQSVKTAADGSTTKNTSGSGSTNAVKKERQGR